MPRASITSQCAGHCLCCRLAGREASCCQILMQCWRAETNQHSAVATTSLFESHQPVKSAPGFADQCRRTVHAGVDAAFDALEQICKGVSRYICPTAGPAAACLNLSALTCTAVVQQICRCQAAARDRDRLARRQETSCEYLCQCKYLGTSDSSCC